MVSTSVPAPMPVDDETVPLPSSEGISFLDAWDAAWERVRADSGGAEVSLNFVYGFEGVTGFDPDGLIVDRDALEPVRESLDGRIQEGGFWRFLFTGDNDTFFGYRVGVDGIVPFGPDRAGFQGVNALQGNASYDSPDAVLGCRRDGADEFMQETGDNYIQYIAQPVQGAQDPNWSLFIVFGTLALIPGEVESPTCVLDQGDGTWTFTFGEALQRDYEPV